ncbi:MAG: DNA primase [Bacteroidota bacterium]|nr:DNA primase [Bacteroidota bacterium]
MSRIARETIDIIFETARIEEVIGEFVNLKKSGSNYKGLSPFTNEKTPSFYVSPAKQIFKDFSSGKGGNVVSFLMEHEQYTYPEALRFLARKYGIEIEEEDQTPEQAKQASERESLFIISQFASEFFADQLRNTEEGVNIGLSYLRERGFTEKSINDFQLGYSPSQRDAFCSHALEKGYSPVYLEQSGLGIKRENGGWLDRFRERVIFPIHSLSGRVIGFGGRILRSDVKTAKYLNSPESPIYHKSRVLYGLHQAKKEVIRLDNCLLVEGYTDVISMHQAGIQNVVSSSGTSLTVEQISLIKRLTPNITILYDGDPAGIKASFRGIDMVLEEGMNVKVLLFPDGEDPDSFARSREPDELKEFIEKNQKDFIQFKTSLLMEGTQGDPIKRAGVIRDIVGSIALIPDPITRDVYIRECSRIMDMEEKVLFSELAILRKKHEEEKSKKRPTPDRRMEVVHTDTKTTPEDVGTLQKATEGKEHYEQERAIVWLLLNYGDHELVFPDNEDPEKEPEKLLLAKFVVADIESDEEFEFSNPKFARIYSQFAQAYLEGKDYPKGQDFSRSEDNELAQLASDLMTEKYQLSDWKRKDIHIIPREEKLERFASEALYRFKETKVMSMIRDLQEKLKTGEVGPEEREATFEHLHDLLNIRKEINHLLGRVI